MDGPSEGPDQRVNRLAAKPDGSIPDAVSAQWALTPHSWRGRGTSAWSSRSLERPRSSPTTEMGGSVHLANPGRAGPMAVGWAQRPDAATERRASSVRNTGTVPAGGSVVL